MYTQFDTSLLSFDKNGSTTYKYACAQFFITKTTKINFPPIYTDDNGVTK